MLAVTFLSCLWIVFLSQFTTSFLRNAIPKHVISSRLQQLKIYSSQPIIGLEAPENVLIKSDSEISKISEADYVVIGSGIGGLSCAALLSYYGYSVIVLESHYLPGGVAHTFERNGFHFDAGR